MKHHAFTAADGEALQQHLDRWNHIIVLFNELSEFPASVARWTIGREGEKHCADLTCAGVRRMNSRTTFDIDRITVVVNGVALILRSPDSQFEVQCSRVELDEWSTSLWIPRAERDHEEIYGDGEPE